MQGMDFDDASWSYVLIGPDGVAIYGEGSMHSHGAAPGHGGRRPAVEAARGAGRLTLMVQRDGAAHSAWVGAWQVMVGYRDRAMDGMVMVDVGELTLPVAAGPVRGPRWSGGGKPGIRRVPGNRIVGRDALANLSVPTLSTNRSEGPACSVVINVYARTRLALELVPESPVVEAGKEASFELTGPVGVGTFTVDATVGRIIGPVGRASRPITIAPGGQPRAKAAAKRLATSGVSVSPTMPRTPATLIMSGAFMHPPEGPAGRDAVREWSRRPESNR